MRRLFIALTLLLGLSGVAGATPLTAVSDSTTCPGTGCVILPVDRGLNYVGIQVSGTFSATFAFSYSIDGSTFNALSLYPDAAGTAASSGTAVGIWRGQAPGVSFIKVALTAYTSGTVNVTVKLDNVNMTGNVGTAYTPGGSTGLVEYNNAGAFGGITGSSWDGTTLTLPKSVIAHIIGGGTAPTVADTSANSCGSGTETITGHDNGGKVTVIGSGGTSCTVTFGAAFTAAPGCSATNETTAALVRATSTTTTVVLAGTFLQNDVIAFTCIGN